ncbi:hypothetical protein J6590_006716 [Homalodisca vitripennis]|nr:hypothetical protein J6590_006716 [Homalodisca vitripennis]
MAVAVERIKKADNKEMYLLFDNQGIQFNCSTKRLRMNLVPCTTSMFLLQTSEAEVKNRFVFKNENFRWSGRNVFNTLERDTSSGFKLSSLSNS